MTKRYSETVALKVPIENVMRQLKERHMINRTKVRTMELKDAKSIEDVMDWLSNRQPGEDTVDIDNALEAVAHAYYELGAQSRALPVYTVGDKATERRTAPCGDVERRQPNRPLRTQPLVIDVQETVD